MSAFTEAEIEYLKSQRLGRLATTNAAGEPHVVPVGFHYNAELDTIDIGGHGIGQSRKFRDAGSGRLVAFVVDDVLPPWQPCGIEMRGHAEALSAGGQAINANFDPEIIRIKPSKIISWGIENKNAFERSSRLVG